MSVHAHVGHAATGADQLRAELERGGDADRLDGDVHSQAARELLDCCDRVFAAVVDRRVRAERARLRETSEIEVDRDDATRREQLGGHDRGEVDRARADDRNRVAGADPSVQDPDLVRRRQDVREEQHLLIGQRLRHLVDGGVGERDASELRLEPVDQVTEDSASSAGAETVVALTAEPAMAARGDADTSTRSPSFSVATPAPVSTTVPTASCPSTVPGFTSGTSPLRMWRSVPQMVDESIWTTASVGSRTVGSWTVSQARRPGPW